MKPDKPWYYNTCYLKKKRKKANKKKRWNILKKKNLLKNGEASGPPLLNFEEGGVVSWGPTFKLLGMSRFPGRRVPNS